MNRIKFSIQKLINFMENMLFNNMFSELTNLSEHLLRIVNNEPVCRYINLNIWRMYTLALEEDLLIIVKLVNENLNNNIECNNFNWKLVIDHDNNLLNDILEKGLVDNHFHLWGSIPLFKISWTYLMNNINDNLDMIYMNKDLKSKNNISVELMKASLIRLFFYFHLESTNSKKIKEYKKYIFKNIWFLLKHDEELMLEKYKIQEIIDNIKENYLDVGKDVKYIDYMFLNDFLEQKNQIEYIKERKFLYYTIRNTVKNKGKYSELLCQYLLIKEKFRSNIIQTSDFKGFYRFNEINYNKNKIIETYNNSNELLYPSLKNIIEQNNIKKMEIRLKIKNTSLETAKYVEYVDKMIDPDNQYTNIIRYILCFSRKHENNKYTNNRFKDESKRNSIKNEADLLETFFIKHPISKRVVGIDVCSSETDYKPEIYSLVYRKYMSFFKLKKTYHVGEEYEDVLYGIRAIDECLEMLNLKSGDRLGHATPLWQNVGKWYERKDYSIETMLGNDFDNTVWLYNNLKNYNYEDTELLIELKKEFEIYSKYIYVNNFESLKDISEFNNITLNECIDRLKNQEYTITDFHEAWKLRKNSPDELMIKLINSKNKKMANLKSIFLAVNYFFNSQILSIGKERVIVEINSKKMYAITSMQDIIRSKIKEKGIYIEICPSSNIILQNIDNYEYNSIENIFNLGLNEKKYKNIVTSINTDDAGIFCTSIKNEYSLIAQAIENLSDENGNYLYKKEEVYRWIDNIRENGFLMSSVFEK